MKKKLVGSGLLFSGIKNLFLIMRLTIFLILISMFSTYASVYSQSTKLMVKMENARIADVFDAIEQQSEFWFFYNRDKFDDNRVVSVDFEGKKVEQILDELFKGQPVTYEIVNRNILIKTENKYPGISEVQQQKSVSGTVTDESGEPLPGVAVVAKGTTKGTVTNADGNYSISNIPDDATLQFSFVGMKSQEVIVGNKTNINVTLEVDAIGLEEVVAIGYGTQKRVSITSAVSTVTSEELTSKSTSNIQQALQGNVPGLTVIDQGGSPGSPVIDMRVRGITTLDNKNAPLVIVDGIEQPLTDLNPNDIESISLLKDASSTAIYGSRGATGVLLITTKRATGEDGQISINYDGYFAIQSANNKPEHMGLEAYMKEQQIAYTNSGINLPAKFTDEGIREYLAGHATDKYKFPLPNTMHDAVLSPAPQHSHNLSLSAGTKVVKTMASLRYFYQDGIIANSNSEIAEMRLNNDFQISPSIKISTDLNYRNKDYRQPYAMDDEVFQHLLLGSQWAVPKYPDGTYGLSSLGNNPLFFAEAQGYRDYNEDYMLGNVKGEWDIIKDLKLSIQYGKIANHYSQKGYKNLYDIKTQIPGVNK